SRKFNRSGKSSVPVIAPNLDLRHLIETAADGCKRVEIAIAIEIRKSHSSDYFLQRHRVVDWCGKSLVTVVFQNRNARRAKKAVADQDIEVSIAIQVAY